MKIQYVGPQEKAAKQENYHYAKVIQPDTQGGMCPIRGKRKHTHQVQDV